MKTSDFDYELPQGYIAQTPAVPRDHSRLMVLGKGDGTIEDHLFYELPGFLRRGDVLVFNDTRVLPARLSGRRADSGGRVEVLLLRRISVGVWEGLVRPGKQLVAGAKVEIENGGHLPVTAEIVGVGEDGVRTIAFSDESRLPRLGRVPLPPYIHTPLHDPERYQTVYARESGSAAAPTAGLHYTPELLRKIDDNGIDRLFVTLHIGLDTFRPVRVEDPSQHRVHREYGMVSAEVATRLSRARSEGRRIIAVGTTTVRLLEAVAWQSAPASIAPFAGWVDLFILPGHEFRLVDGLITNFHLPRSSLLMLVSAFAGREKVRRAYEEAIARGYRFYSFGDAMLIM
jgi:S-adenosylmethionine:tRNA ribosyltransferase-isomerase